MSRKYITTAIDYPNAPPHMGHVLEKVLADVVARWLRLSGHDVRFQIGTDEHGVKIQQTAEREGMSPQALVDRNVPLFRHLYEQLQISFDTFIRTSDTEKHWPTVIELWKKLHAAGMLEKRAYTGLYCSGCERFLTKRDIENGVCPTHKKAPEEVQEENWFFLLSKDTENLKNLLTKVWDGSSYRIIPKFRAQETLSLIDQGLEDISFSRPKSSLAWGIPVPNDPDQTMYVWCDALTNYISGLGLLTKKADPCFWDDAEVTHVIGKDIARFHALYWPSMLHHAGVRTPDRLLIHGFLTSEGEKMSKSLGNVVIPSDVITKFGVDPLRFYLSHEVPVGRDGDFSWDRMQELYDAVLRNKIGNLLNRALVLLNKEGGNFVIPEDSEMQEHIIDFWNKYAKEMNEYDFTNAVADAVAMAVSGNVDMEQKKPWALNGQERITALGIIVEKLRHIALMLLPFVPETAQKISRQLNVPYADRMLNNDFVITEEMKQWGSQKDWKAVGTPEILFPPLER